MKITLFILVLAVAAATLTSAAPQRGGRRFFPRRRAGQNEPAQEAAEPAVEDVAPEETKLEKPRFKPSIRRTGSFRPKSSAPVAPREPEVEALPAVTAVREEVAPAVSQPQPAGRTRSRGSRNFLESIKKGGASGLDQRQIELIKESGVLEGSRSPSTRSQSGGVRQSSRVASRPSSSRPQSSSSVRRPSRPLSSRKQETTTAAPVEAPAPAPVVEENKSEATRRQRLLQLKNRNRSGGAPKKGKMMQDMPMDDKIAVEETKMEKSKPLVDAAEEMKPATKLDDQVVKPLDEAVKETLMEDKTKQKKMKDQEKIPSLDEGTDPVLDTALPEAEPEAKAKPSTTTSAPSTTLAPATTTEASSRRRISSINRLRSQRTRTRGGVSRNRASTPVDTSSSAVASPVAAAPAPSAPRTSSRRGGRGNSRGGAALASTTSSRGGRTGSFTPRVSSRNRARPVQEVGAAPQEEVQESRRSGSSRRRG